MIQTFSPLALLLSGHGCCSYPFRVITRHRSIKRWPSESPEFQTYSSFIHYEMATIAIHVNQGQLSCQYRNIFLCLLVHWTWGAQSGQTMVPASSSLVDTHTHTHTHTHRRICQGLRLQNRKHEYCKWVIENNQGRFYFFHLGVAQTYIFLAIEETKSSSSPASQE